MKRAFVRALWGNVYWINNHSKQIRKIVQDAKDIQENPFTEPFHIYVMGEKDADALEKNKALMEMATVHLVDKAPKRWCMETQMWRHKLDIFEAAMKDFDEVVFLDWDCKPTRKLPDDFWDQLNLRAPFQANLYQYRTKKCLWRDTDWRKTCNGGFVYMRDKDIPNKIIGEYNELDEWVRQKKAERALKGKELRFREKSLILDDEPAMSKYVDGLYDGWPGSEFYWENHEPMCCNVKKSAYSREVCELKDACFKHWV